MLKYAELYFTNGWDDFDQLYGFQTNVELLTIVNNTVHCNCYWFGRNLYCRSAIMLGHRLGVAAIPEKLCDAFVQNKCKLTY